MGIKYVLPSSQSLILAMAETVRFWRWVLAQHNSSHNHLHRPPAAKETRSNQASTSIMPTPCTVDDASVAATSGDFLITTEDDADIFVAVDVSHEQEMPSQHPNAFSLAGQNLMGRGSNWMRWLK